VGVIIDLPILGGPTFDLGAFVPVHSIEPGFQPGDVPELAADLFDHRHRRATDCLHGKRREKKRQHSAEDRKIYDDAHGLAEYGNCVAISTKAAIKEMVKPGLLAVAAPVIVGFGGNLLGAGCGAQMLGGLLAGVTVTGVLMALFQANAGGAWDNAKKMIEEGYEVNGVMLRKGSDAHKAAVVGDTVGDPFKDTSGPSLNILLKLMSVVALVIASMI
jgi:K(+)-stimulated pyrophosphate-energized sodium pump